MAAQPHVSLLWFLACVALAGCQQSHRPRAHGYDLVASLAGSVNWQVSTAADPSMPSVAATRLRGNGPTWVYIEGDGRAFEHRVSLSADPTPDDPVALRLAMAPQDAPVVYLGRPCQYVIAGGANCDSKWWSTARYSDEVVAAVDRMVDRLLARHSAEGLILVGYSGGGAVAALLAARRRDVRGLVTIAANLDTEAWAELHRVSPLMDSVNPASRAADIGRTPQVHFAGAKDAIVPPAIIQSFMARLPSKSDAELVVEPAFDHKCCWSLEWERLRHTAEMLLLR